MDGYESSSSKYKCIKSNLEKYQSKISADLAGGTQLEFIYYSNGAGDLKTADTHDGHRLVAFPIAEAEQKTYWVKRDLIQSQSITTEGVDKGTILFNSLNTLFPENPIQYTFQEETPSGSSDEALIDLANPKTCKDNDGEAWYEVKLPFDDKGVLHYLGVLLGVNRNAQEKGWVKESDTVLTTALNWPGFKIAKETGTGSQDAKIDFKNLTPFFKELFEDIDTSGDGSISAKEMKAALQDDILADRLSRVIAKHPSEWQTDPSLSKWQYLQKLVPDDAAFEEAKTQINNLAWWDDAQCAGADVPMSPEVYHLHPLSFLKQIGLVKPTDLGWMKIAKGEIGVKEIEGSNHHTSIIKYHANTSLKAKTDEVPWCSSFVNWVVNESGYAGTNSAAALSWKSWGEEIKSPVYGSIAIIDYGSGKGHVGFVLGVQGSSVLILGGNQKDSVRVSKFKRSSFKKFVLPKGFPKDKCVVRNIEGDYKEINFKETR